MLNFDYAVSSRFQHHLRLDYFDEDVDINDLGFFNVMIFVGCNIFFGTLCQTLMVSLGAPGRIDMERRENIAQTS